MSNQFQSDSSMMITNNMNYSNQNPQIYRPEESYPNFNMTAPIIPVNEIIKNENKFNYSVASLGDIYKGINEKKDYDEEEKFKNVIIENPLFYESDQVNAQHPSLSKTTQSFRPKSSMSSFNKSQSNPHVNNVYLTSPDMMKMSQRDKFLLEHDPAKKQGRIEVKCLHKAPPKESKKYSHVVSGKINPPQSTFSVKEVVDKHIENHINEMKPYVLYPSKVKIDYDEPQPTGFRTNPLIMSSQEKYDKNSMMVIGKGYSPKKTDNDNHVRFRPSKENTYERKYISSRKARKTLNVSEKFVSAVDDYFYSSEMKIPARNKIEDIVKYARDVEKSLNSFNEELTGKKSNTKYEDPFRKSLKEKKGLIKPNPPKVYPEIDETYKRNVKEKLSRMQLELRSIFDNITQIREHDPHDKKLSEMISRAQELTKLIEHLALDVQKSQQEFKQKLKKKKMNESHHTVKSNSKPIEQPKPNVSVNTKKKIHNFNRSITMNNRSLLKTTGFNPIMEEENSKEFHRGNSLKNSKTFQSIDDDDAIPITNPLFQPQNVKSIVIDNNKLREKTPQKNKVLYNFDPKMNQNKKKSFKGEELSVTPKIDVYFPKSSVIPKGTSTLNQSHDILDVNLSKSFAPNMTQSNLYQSTVNQNPSTTYRTNLNNTYMNQSHFSQNLAMTQSQNFEITQSQNLGVTQSQYQTADIPNIYDKTTSSMIPPQTSQMMNTNVLSQSQVVNDPNMTINRFNVPNPQEIKIDSKANVILDDRFSAFNVEFPVKYYYEVSKENEPPVHKDWYIRPHHTETFSNSKYAIPDDVLNTKYISYYGPAEKEEKQKTRQEMIEELIAETRGHIEKLQYEMFQGANSDKHKEYLYNKLERAKEEAKKTYKPGMYIDKDKNKQNIKDILSQQENTTSYSEMFNNNEDVQQTNLTIDVYSKLLAELREKERELLIEKRKQEYERIRPPVKKWFELKGEEFQTEMQRNKMVINAKPEYFEKIKQLQSEDLY